MGETRISCVYPRLQLAYLLQFAIWGSWNIALGGFLNSVHMPGWQIGYIFMAIPLGAIIAPMFIGPIADRFFSAQKVLGILHVISGIALALCGVICLQGMESGSVSFPRLMGLMLLSGICYMPSIPLINTVVFKHLPDVSSAPRVFIFGTVGWILVNLVVEIFCEGASKPYFFFVGGGCGIFLGLYSFTLPNTPPKGAPAKGEKNDVLGLGALGLFKNPVFTMFVLCAFMVSIFGSNYYFPALVPYLSEYGYPAPLALGTLNQFSELFFMAILGLCVYRFGLKWVLAFGMSAWAIRYLLFTIDGFRFALIGLLIHGLAYAFLYTAAYMFGDKVAPPHLKASVQSLLAFLLLGIGQVLSGWIYGYQLDKCAPQLTGTVALATVQKEETITTTEKLIKTEAPKTEAPKVEVKKEAPKTEVKKEAPKTEVKKEAPKTEVKKEAPKTEVKKEAPKTEVKKESPKTEVKKEAPKTEVKKGAPKTEVKKEAPKTEVKKGAPKTEVKKEAPKTEVKKGAPKTEVKKGAPKTEVKKEAPKTEVKKEAPKTEVKKEAPKTEVKKEAPKTEVKKEAPKTEVKKGAKFQYAKVSSFIADDYKVVEVDDQVKETIVPSASKPLPRWEDPAMKDSNWRFLDLAKAVKFFRGNLEVFDQGENLGNYQDKENGRLGSGDLPDNLKVDDVVYSRAELDATFAKIVKLLKERRTKIKTVFPQYSYDIDEETITRAEYLSVQRHDWGRFFLRPACFIAFWVFIFIIFGREPQEYKEN